MRLIALSKRFCKNSQPDSSRYNSNMKITLNGDPKELPAPMTIQELLDSLNIPSGRVACELNVKIIRRAQYSTTTIQEGDSVEIIQAIGGG